MRFWEIDFARSVAIVLMVIFNWSFTLSYLGVLWQGDWLLSGSGGFHWFFWWLFPRIIGGLFIFIAGISLTLSYNRISNWSSKRIYLKYLKRGGFIFLLGIGITLVTWLMYPDYFIVFGILHLIGLSIILSIPFLRSKYISLVIGLILMVAGAFLQMFSFGFPQLLWLGFTPAGFSTFDYWPLLPWFGLMLIGISAGNFGYNKKRTFKLPELPRTRGLGFLGRHSLVIYLIHQPILLIVLYLLGFPVI